MIDAYRLEKREQERRDREPKSVACQAEPEMHEIAIQTERQTSDSSTQYKQVTTSTGKFLK